MQTRVEHRRTTQGPPHFDLTISYTKRHGLGWALFRPHSHIACDFGGFVVPEYVTPEEIAMWVKSRTEQFYSGQWTNPGRYDYLLSMGWFPAVVRRVDKASCVRERIDNGPMILAVLRGHVRSNGLSLKPSRNCPSVELYRSYSIDQGNVAVMWESR